MPVVAVRNTVEQVVLAHVGEVLGEVVMVTVVGYLRRHRVAETVRRILPWQGVVIDGVVRSRLVVVEVEPLQYLVVLVYLVVGDDGFGDCGGLAGCLFLLFRTVLVWAVVDDRIAADIEPIVAFFGFLIDAGCTCRLPASCTQTVDHRVGFLTGGDIILGRHVEEVVMGGDRIGTRAVCLRLRAVGVPFALRIPAAAPDHRVFARFGPSAG